MFTCVFLLVHAVKRRKLQNIDAILNTSSWAHILGQGCNGFVCGLARTRVHRGLASGWLKRNPSGTELGKAVFHDVSRCPWYEPREIVPSPAQPRSFPLVLRPLSCKLMWWLTLWVERCGGRMTPWTRWLTLVSWFCRLVFFKHIPASLKLYSHTLGLVLMVE